MSFPYIFTFYSYKGGVGRSMALLNAAYALVARGRHVLMVDLDLEAPGVSGFLGRNHELAPPQPDPKRDVLDWLGMVIRASVDELDALEPVQGFVRCVDPERLAVLTPKMGKLGRLDVIIADQHRDYWSRLEELGLSSFSRDDLLLASGKLWRYLKNQRFPFQPLGLEEDPPEPTPYDYVLVDSRTGITESGGLCVGPLADRLVVVTGLNDQNVVGTRDFLSEVGIRPEKRAPGSPPWDDADPIAGDDDDDEARAGLGPKPTLIVASPLPAGEIAYKKQRLEEVERSLGSVAVTLSYHPQMAVMETLFVRDHPSEYLAKEYKELTQRLMSLVRDHPRQVFSQRPKRSDAESKRGEGVAELLRQVTVEPRLAAVLLLDAANRMEPSDADGFRLARRLNAAIDRSGLVPKHQAQNNWGNALLGQASITAGPQADVLFAAAYAKYERALDLKPDKHDALFNWGNALSSQAEMKAGPEADVLFAAAYAKYEKALELKPDKHEVLNNWGAALSDQAKMKAGPEADVLFAAAYAKLERALELEPDKQAALNNWGIALSHQAKTKAGEPRSRLLERARERLLAAEALRPDSAAYNLACLDAIEGNVASCVNRLRALRASGIADVSRAKVEGDTDFEGVINDPTFRALLEELPD